MQIKTKQKLTQLRHQIELQEHLNKLFFVVQGLDTFHQGMMYSF